MPKPKMFTQAEVDALSAREREQGARGYTNKVIEELGMSIEDAAAIIQNPGLPTKLSAEITAIQAETEEMYAESERIKARTAETMAKIADMRRVGKIRQKLGGTGLAQNIAADYLDGVLGVDFTDEEFTAATDLLGREVPGLVRGTGRPPPPPANSGARRPGQHRSRSAMEAGHARWAKDNGG